VNTDAPWPDLDEAEWRVLGIQTKLHRWATDDPGRCFDDLFNLVCDPAFMVVAWERVRTNRGARSAGVDGVKPGSIVFGRERFLTELRDDLKARRFRPLPVRERLIPKPGTSKYRRLGIPTARDRTVQAALKLVLEPIFEADFEPCSYGFRPRRRAQDAIEEIRHFGSHSYEWVLEGDIKSCFDEIAHSPLLMRLRDRIGDKRILGLVKAFLKSGVLTEEGEERDTNTGTPQGGILSPLLSNIALSVLDKHFAEYRGDQISRAKRRRHGLANYRLIRYADDFVVMVSGTEAHANALRDEVAAVLSPIGLRLSEEKTTVVHIDQGFDFLGLHIQRRRKAGTARMIVYTYPSKKAVLAICAKVRAVTRRSTQLLGFEALLHRLNQVLRGWCNYHRHGSAAATFGYLNYFVWRRVTQWLRTTHKGITWRSLRRRFLRGWRPAEGKATLFYPSEMPIIRYRYRGSRIPTPWSSITPGPAA
jgi:RNA-directed DNA polymerase